jgi:Ca2+-binding EF-hand superfamily protein
VCSQAFRRLDKDGSGVVTLSDLVSVYSTKFHPEVIAGKKTHEEAVTEFMSQWDTKDKDGIITVAEFEEYYKARGRRCRSS